MRPASTPPTNHDHVNDAPADFSNFPLMVIASGMCCAVGYDRAAASCALRAGMDQFQESDFFDHRGEQIKVAMLPLGKLWGPKRLAGIVHNAILDCIRDTPNKTNPTTTALILLTAEDNRPHSDAEYARAAYRTCEEQFKFQFHPSSCIFPGGRAGLGIALKKAHHLLHERTVTRVLLVGTDSYLNAASIQYYLKERRLQCSGNSDGFIPGEGAGCLMLELGNAQQPALYISGIGMAMEAATLYNDIPNRSQGLVQAIRAACDNAGILPGALQYRMSDHNGEKYYIEESTNAHTRLMTTYGTGLPLTYIADSVGETGAACGLLSISYVHERMRGKYPLGQTGLLHMANDDGLRTAIILQTHASATQQ